MQSTCHGPYRTVRSLVRPRGDARWRHRILPRLPEPINILFECVERSRRSSVCHQFFRDEAQPPIAAGADLSTSRTDCSGTRVMQLPNVVRGTLGRGDLWVPHPHCE